MGSRLAKSAAVIVLSWTACGCRSTELAADRREPRERTGLVRRDSVGATPDHAARVVAVPPSEAGSGVAPAESSNAISQASFREPDAAEQGTASGVPDEPKLTLADLESLALANNPTLRHANAHIKAARGQQLQAGLYPNPTIGYHAVNVGSRGTAGRQAGFVQQRFVTGGKLQLDERIAGHEIRNAQSQLSAARHRILTDVRSQFYRTLVAQRRQELASQLSDVAAEVASSTKQLLDAAQASENTFLQAEIEAEQAAILLNNATNELREHWQQLAAVTGQPHMQQVPLVGDLESVPEYKLDEISATLAAMNPMLAAASARIERARVAITRARQEVVPDLTLMADGARTNQTKSNTAQVRLGVEVPLWDRNEGNIAVAESQLAGARAEYRRIELQLRQRLASVFRQYSNARHQSDRYRDSILPRAERSLKLVREGYDNGQVEYLTLLNSQQKFVEVSLAYAESLEALHTAAALLDGQLMDDSLSKGDE